MNDDQQQSPQPPPDAQQRSVPPEPPIFTALISAGLFLYVGFGLGLVGVTGDAIYDGSVTVLVWGARCIGFAILLGLLMSLLKLPGATLVDLFSSLVATLLCLGVGVIWIYFSDTDGFLLFIFALVNASAAHSTWKVWQYSRAVGQYEPPLAPPSGES